jgi:hypothetical protein
VARLADWKTGWLDYRRKRFWAWVLVAFYTLFGFVIAPLIVRHVIVDQVHSQLGLTATLEDVDINPYALSVRLEKFSLADARGAKLVAFDSFTANVQLSSIINRALTFSELTLVHPFVNIVRGENQQLNLAALVPPADPNAKPEPESAPLRMIIDSAAIEGGRVAVVDHGGRQVFQTELGPVDLKITNLSTLPNREGQQTFSMQTNFGGRLDWTGHIALEPFHSSGHMALTHERLADFSAYLPSDLLLSIVDGTLDVAFDYKMADNDGALEADLSNLALAVKQLGLAQRADAAPSADLLRLGELAVAGGHIAWPQRTVAFERVALTQPQISLSRDSQQRFVWETLWQSSVPVAAAPPTAPAAAPEAAAAAAAETAPPAVAEPTRAAAASSAAEPASEAPPWSVAVAKFEVADGRVGFNDQGVGPAAVLGISGLGATIDGLSLADNTSMPFTLNFNVDGGGSVALAGTLTALPAVRVDAKSQISGFGLPTVNPYLRADTYLQLASGALSVDGHLVSNPDEAFGYDGELQLADLEVQREGETERFAGLKSLALKGITLSTAQRKVDIARAELDSAFAKIHISKDRVLNLANVTRASAPGGAETRTANAQPAAPQAVAETPWAIKLARLKVTNGDADFTDESLPVPFHRAISSINGGIDALDSVSRSPSQIALTGQVGEYGSLRVSGHLRALDPLGDTDIVASFKNVEMPGASPYAIRFAGHKVASGKLDLDLHYKLKKGILDGQHKIVLRDFALGEKVDYPEALDLPYGLAISLLKDSSGNIDIDLPVEGDVNDPTFRIGGVIMKALANLIMKIVTAPFSLLGRLVGFGDSENFDQILFDPGVADISPPEREKVSKVAQALVLRPNLALTLHGVTDPEADTRALRESSLRARLDTLVGDADANGRKKVIQKMAKESVPGLDLDALRDQFKTPPTPGAKPVLDETAYLNALVQKLIDAEPVAPDAVASLAAARAAAVRTVLAENTSLDAARISDGDPHNVKLKDGAVPMKLEVKIP